MVAPSKSLTLNELNKVRDQLLDPVTLKLMMPALMRQALSGLKWKVGG